MEMRHITFELNFALVEVASQVDPKFMLKAELVIYLDCANADCFNKAGNVLIDFHWAIQIIIRLGHRDQTETSKRVFRAHLTGYEYINFSAVVLVISQALIHLGARQIRETPSDDAVYSFASL